MKEKKNEVSENRRPGRRETAERPLGLVTKPNREIKGAGDFMFITGRVGESEVGRRHRLEGRLDIG